MRAVPEIGLRPMWCIRQRINPFSGARDRLPVIVIAEPHRRKLSLFDTKCVLLKEVLTGACVHAEELGTTLCNELRDLIYCMCICEIG